jgi:hypothetical protein
VSHWFLDLLVHRQDLPLVHDHEEKLGFGLWNEPLLVIPLEMGLLLGGFAVYMGASKARGAIGNIVPWLVLATLFAAQFINWFTPHASDQATFSVMGLTAYFGLAALAFWLDRTRK